VHGALTDLWLDSHEEYEPWAAERLKDKNGFVNVEGMAIAHEGVGLDSSSG
jgi:hypothetical protein